MSESTNPGTCVQTLARRVQFAETDLAGVMHFSNYFRLLEEVEHAWWRSLGRSVVEGHGASSAASLSWPRVAVRCEYFAPARFEDVLELRLEVFRPGRKSLDLAVEFWRNGARLARAEAKVVCCRVQPGGRFEAIEIPADLRGRIEQELARAGRSA